MGEKLKLRIAALLVSVGGATLVGGAQAQGWAGALGGLGQALEREAEHQGVLEQQRRAFEHQKQLLEHQMRLEQQRERAAEIRAQQERERQWARQQAAEQEQAAARARAAAEADRVDRAERERAERDRVSRERADERAKAAEQQRQLDLLTVIHPDWRAIRNQAAFSRWVQQKLAPDEQEKFAASWDAAYVASVISRYKQSRGK
jgi:septal ring factor EnvC (AmiA/AmiB activator)